MTPDNAARDAAPSEINAIEPAAHAELSRLASAMARQLCRGGGPAGGAGLDAEQVAREAVRKLVAEGLASESGSVAEKSRLYALVQAAVIEASRASRSRARPAAAGEGASPRADVRSILSLLPGECGHLVERALLDAKPCSQLAREVGKPEGEIRAQLAGCIRRARLIATGRGRE